MTDREQHTQEAFERVNEALGNVAEALKGFSQNAEAAKRTIDKIKYFCPIQAEGTVE